MWALIATLSFKRTEGRSNVDPQNEDDAKNFDFELLEEISAELELKLQQVLTNTNEWMIGKSATLSGISQS